MNTTIPNQQIVNTTDIRFKLGRILDDLGRQGKPLLIISRSKPKAWLYPYEPCRPSSGELFSKWQKVLPKYKKIKAKNLVEAIRKDRDRI
jgi:hypothetical protein